MPPTFEISNAAVMVGALTSMVMCFAIVITKSWHGHLTMDGTTGVQKFHTSPTPRVGGLGIMLGLYMARLQVSAPVALILEPMIVAGSLAFLFGLAEDITGRISVRNRLLATMGSGVLAWWLTGTRLTHVDVWGVDYLLMWLPLSVAFTAFAIGGVANAINIIDGFNGLAAGVILISLTALGLIAHGAGDFELVRVCMVLGGVTVGFLVINFPFGKIFMGDGGAYLLGFMLAWLAVLLAMRNPGVSPWAGLMACGYPILEVLFSITRRYRRNLHPGHPDRLHLHSLIKCRIARKQFSSWPAVLKNSAVAPLVWGLSCVPAAMAVLFSGSTLALMVAFLVCAWLYARFYRRLVRFSW